MESSKFKDIIKELLIRELSFYTRGSNLNSKIMKIKNFDDWPGFFMFLIDWIFGLIYIGKQYPYAINSTENLNCWYTENVNICWNAWGLIGFLLVSYVLAGFYRFSNTKLPRWIEAENALIGFLLIIIVGFGSIAWFKSNFIPTLIGHGILGFILIVLGMFHLAIFAIGSEKLR